MAEGDVLVRGAGGDFASLQLVLDGTVDPSAGAGVAAPIRTFYRRDNAGTGELWFKTGAADTAWTLQGGGLPDLSGVSLIPDPTVATAEDVANAYNALAAALGVT